MANPTLPSLTGAWGFLASVVLSHSSRCCCGCGSLEAEVLLFYPQTMSYHIFGSTQVIDLHLFKPEGIPIPAFSVCVAYPKGQKQ